MATAPVPTTLDDALDLKVSKDPLFYGNSSFQTYTKDRENFLTNSADNQIARKDARTDETFNVMDIVSTAPYETDIAFEPQDKTGASLGQYYPNARERFLQLDFLSNILNPENQSAPIIERRKQLINEGYVDENGNLDTVKLQSLHNPEQYQAFIDYVVQNKDLEGLPYEERERPSRTRVKLGPTLPPISSDLTGGLFDINEGQRAAYSARGADPDTNYLSVLSKSGLTLEDGSDAFSDLKIGRIVSPRNLNKKELENLLNRFDPSAVVQYLNFNDSQNGEFIVTSDLTGGVPVPFGDVQPLESLSEGDSEAFLTEVDVMLSQEAPNAILGGAFIKLVRNGLDTLAENQVKRNADKISQGATNLETTGTLGVLGKMSGLATASGVGEALAEATKLYTAKESGYQPDITDARIWEISGLAGVYAAGGEFGGELVIKSFGKLKNFFTGERLPESLLARLRASGEYIRRKRNRELGELPEGDPEVSQAVMNEFIIDSGGELGESLASLGDLTNDKIIQGLESNLLNIMDQGSEGYAVLNALLNNQGKFLDRYFESALVRLKPDQKIDREQFNELVNRIRVSSRQKRIDATENDIFDIEQQLDLEERLDIDKVVELPFGDVPVPVGTNLRTAEEIQRIVKGGRPSYPQYTSELTQMYRQATDPIYKKFDEVFNRTVTDIDGNDFQVYKEPVVPMPKFIGAQLNKMLNANKPENRIFGTADDAEVADIIRTMLQNRSDEGISIQQLADPKKFEEQRRFSIEEITRTMENLEVMFNSHPNQKVREEGKELIQGLADARSEAYRIQYKKITGAKSAPTEAKSAQNYEEEVLNLLGNDISSIKQEIVEEQGKVNGRYIYQLSTKEPSELGSYILNSNPSDINGLIGLLSTTPEGLIKLQQVRQVVFDAMEKEVSGDAASSVQQAQRLAKLSNSNKEQLQILFPQAELNPRDFKKIKIDLETQGRKLNKLNDVLDNMINPETGDFAETPIEIVDAYFRMSPQAKRDFKGTQTWQQLKELSKLADEYPDLRTAFRTDFARRMRNLAGIDSDIAQGSISRAASTREQSGFDLDELTNLFLYPTTNKELADDLSLVVGEKDALEFAINLRNFSRRMRTLAAKELKTSPDKKTPDLQTILGFATGTITRIRKGIFGQLSRAGYRSNLILEELSPKIADHLAIILANPKKLDEFMKVYDTKRMPLGDALRVVEQIALGRYGAQQQEETEVEKFKKEVSKEFDLPRFPNLEEGLRTIKGLL